QQVIKLDGHRTPFDATLHERAHALDRLDLVGIVVREPRGPIEPPLDCLVEGTEQQCPFHALYPARGRCTLTFLLLLHSRSCLRAQPGHARTRRADLVARSRTTRDASESFVCAYAARLVTKCAMVGSFGGRATVPSVSPSRFSSSSTSLIMSSPTPRVA